MRRFNYITNIIILLCIMLVGCTEDIPRKISMDDMPSPPSLKIVNSSVREDQEINPEHAITVTFNNIMDSVTIDIIGVKGNTILDTTNTFATFKSFSTIPDGIYTLTIKGKDEYGQEFQAKTVTFSVKGGSIEPPPSSMIAYTSNLDGDYEIYLIKTDGSDLTQLTSNFAQDTQPVWSPNGKFIAFSSDRNGAFIWNSDIFVMRTDGSAQTNLTKSTGVSEFSPFWSFDGKKIQYQTDIHGFNEYYVMNADGTGQRLMNDEEIFDFAYPAVLGEFGGDMLISNNLNGNYEIYFETFDGKNSINLTNHIANDISPAWSPNGRKIVFVSDRDFNNEIYIMDADGSNQKRVTRNFVDDNNPCWSPF